jgi:hypothetical protein
MDSKECCTLPSPVIQPAPKTRALVARLPVLCLVGLLSILLVLHTRGRTAHPNPAARTPGYEGPARLTCPVLSDEERVLDDALRVLETEEPTWTKTVWQSDKVATWTAARLSWLTRNPSWRFEVRSLRPSFTLYD